MVAIKKAKLTYWQSHQYGQQNVDLRTNTPHAIDLKRTTSQRDMRNYRRSIIGRSTTASASAAAPTGPTAYDMDGVLERGYLVRFDDNDKKGTRLWFTLRDVTLTCYKTERVCEKEKVHSVLRLWLLSAQLMRSWLSLSLSLSSP
jgi:hypothetical protein